MGSASPLSSPGVEASLHHGRGHHTLGLQWLVEDGQRHRDPGGQLTLGGGAEMDQSYVTYHVALSSSTFIIRLKVHFKRHTIQTIGNTHITHNAYRTITWVRQQHYNYPIIRHRR